MTEGGGEITHPVTNDFHFFLFFLRKTQAALNEQEGIRTDYLQVSHPASGKNLTASLYS